MPKNWRKRARMKHKYNRNCKSNQFYNNDKNNNNRDGMLISIRKWKAAKRSEIECSVLDEAL